MHWEDLLMRSTVRNTTMTEGNIAGLLIRFSLPLLIGNLFQLLYNTVDSIVVGNFVGSQALAAVGSTGSIVNMVVSMMSGLSIGATVVIAQYYGAHDNKNLHDAVHTTMLAALVSSTAFIIIGVLLVDPLLHFMRTPADVFPQAHTYLTIYFCGLPGLLIYNMTSGILRAVGDSKRPLYFLCFCTLFNTVFDLLFVLVFHMGVEGVAYATILAEYLSAILTCFVLIHTNAPYRLNPHNLAINWPILKNIIRIGFPTALQQVLTCFSNVFVQSYINAFGSACMAGWSACNKADSFVSLPCNTLSMAVTTYVGQNIGAQKLKRAQDGVKVSMRISFAITLALIIILNVFAEQILRLFTQEAEVLYYGEQFVRVMSPFYCVMIIYQIHSGALRGAGIVRTPVLIMLGSFVAFRQVYLFIMSHIHSTPALTAFGYPAGWIVCTILMLLCYRRSILGKRHPAQSAS